MERILAEQDISMKLLYIFEDFEENNYIESFEREIISYDLAEVGNGDLKVVVEYDHNFRTLDFVAYKGKNELGTVHFEEGAGYEEFEEKLEKFIIYLGIKN